jgi:alkylated DNA repair protein (DNA oxidative demethylase)
VSVQRTRVSSGSRGRPPGPGSRPAAPAAGLHYDRHFVTPAQRSAILEWIASIRPIWEQRYSTTRALPPGREQRRLLRPVYWLGAWQFACLDYYRPPHGTLHRCVHAEPYPPVLAALVARAEAVARRLYRGADLPAGWKLNTCLVNFYGSRLEGDRRIDTARVGEHKDFEPGPVASVSLGARALFQFVQSRGIDHPATVAFEQWLDDGSLQVFGGDRWKKHLFHRVQRVDRKGEAMEVHAADFATRRINFTFRYVPDRHIERYAALPEDVADDVRGYMEELARHCDFFRREVAARNSTGTSTSG